MDWINDDVVDVDFVMGSDITYDKNGATCWIEIDDIFYTAGFYKWLLGGTFFYASGNGNKKNKVYLRNLHPEEKERIMVEMLDSVIKKCENTTY